MDELAILQQQAQELATIPGLKEAWAKEKAALLIERDHYRDQYEATERHARQAEEEYVAVVEEQAHTHEQELRTARADAQQWKDRCEALEITKRDKDEQLRVRERDLDVVSAALRKCEGQLEATHEARQRAEAEAQRLGIQREADATEWLAKSAAWTSTKAALEARMESLEAETHRTQDQLREQQHQGGTASEENQRLREALHDRERAQEDARHQSRRELEDMRAAWQEEKDEWQARIQGLQASLRQVQHDVHEAKQGALATERQAVTGAIEVRQASTDEARHWQEEAERLREELEEERVRGIKVENDWKFVVRDLQCQLERGGGGGRGGGAAAAGGTGQAAAAAEEEAREEDAVRAVAMLKEDLQKVMMRSMHSIQKAEKRAEAYKAKCFELHERLKGNGGNGSGSVVM